MPVHRPTRIEAVECHAWFSNKPNHMLRSYNTIIVVFWSENTVIIYQWMVMLSGTWLVTLMRRRSPSLATMRGPGNCPFTVTMLFVWHSLVTFWCLICVTTTIIQFSHSQRQQQKKQKTQVNNKRWYNECCNVVLQNGSVWCCHPEKPQTCKIWRTTEGKLGFEQAKNPCFVKFVVRTDEKWEKTEVHIYISVLIWLGGITWPDWRRSWISVAVF